MPDFDEARFIEEVLKPISDGWRPTDNLFRVYGLPVGTTDTATIERALSVVAQQLTAQRLQRAFPAAVNSLRSGHDDATKVLTTPSRRREHASEVSRIAEQLQATLKDRLAEAPGLPPQLVMAMAEESRGGHTRREIREALGELNASEQDPIELPTPAAPKAWPQVRTALSQLGQPSLFDYLETTAELAGVSTTTAHLDKRSETLKRRRDAAKTTEENLIVSLRGILRSGSVIDALRFELLNHLQSKAAYRFPVLLTEANANASRLRALGITKPPAAVAYAVWCRQRYPEVMGRRGSSWRFERKEAHAAKELRRELEALKSGDRLTADEKRELAELTAKISQLDAEIERAAGLEATDPEAAAKAYLAVRSQTSDPAVESGLVRCRPKPVRQVTAQLEGDRVAIAWPPSASTVGRLGYTVVRALNHRPIGVADGVEMVTDVTSLSAIDQAPPAAQELFYAVFAVREGVAHSEPTVSAPVLAVPEVSNLELVPASDSIRGRWTLPAAATDVEVTRRVVGRDGVWSPINARQQDFTDATVRVGVSYEYRVQVGYRLPGGRRVKSAGRTVSGRCQQVPTAVSRLGASLDGDDVVVSWGVPPAGDVEIRELRAGRLPETAVIPLSTLDRIGPNLGPVILRSRSELRVRPEPGTGSMVLVAVTVLGDLAAIGPTQVLDRRIRPVRDLNATRRGREAELTWVWPEEAVEARVLHRVGADPEGPEDASAEWHLVSRASYDSVGVRFPLQPGENVFAVSTTSGAGGTRSFGPLVKVAVRSVDEVAYRIVKAGWLGRRRVLTVGSAQGPALPRLHLVARSRTRPMEPTQGEVLLDLPGGTAELSEEFVVPPGLSRPVHLRLFSLDPSVVMRAPPPDQLIVK